jgi:hypothetical protein
MAQALAVCHVISRTTLGDRHDVIGLGFALVRTNAAAVTALPRIAHEHGLPPRSVPLVAVALGRSVGTSRLVTTTTTRQSGGLVAWDALRHG